MRFDPADLKRLITVETKLVVVNFPHNPTGAAVREFWRRICQAAEVVSHELSTRHNMIQSNVLTFHTLL